MPLRFAVLVIGLGLVECSLGFFAGSLITLLAAEHPLEHSRRFRFEVRPLRSRDRVPQAALGPAAEPAIRRRSDARLILGSRVSDDCSRPCNCCDLTLNGGRLGGGLVIPGRRLLRKAVALLRLTLLLGALCLLFCGPLRGCPLSV